MADLCVDAPASLQTIPYVLSITCGFITMDPALVPTAISAYDTIAAVPLKDAVALGIPIEVYQCIVTGLSQPLYVFKNILRIIVIHSTISVSISRPPMNMLLSLSPCSLLGQMRWWDRNKR
jgi:hypothetical protein